MLSCLALLLALTPPPSVLSPEASEHNTRAMRFYDAGQLAPAVDEFYAAYQSMPDARRDLEGRQQLLGSMSFALRELHAQTGDAGPLCRLQNLLRAHVDALTAAFPEDPRRTEIEGAQAHHEQVTQQLAALGPDACEPPPPLLRAPIAAKTQLPDEPLTRAPAPPADDPRPRRSQVAGGVLLPLGVVALGVVAGVASMYRRDLARADDLYRELVDCRCDDADGRSRLRGLMTTTRRDEALMTALAVTGGALITAGAALLVRGTVQRRRARLGLDLRRQQLGLTISGEF